MATRVDRIPTGQLHTCTPVVLEVGYSARNAEDHDRRIHRLMIAMQWVSGNSEIEQRAIAVQGLLAQRGQHRSVKLSDLLIAATAEAHGLTVLHYDSDYDLIGAVTGQPREWVVPRGTVD